MALDCEREGYGSKSSKLLLENEAVGCGVILQTWGCGVVGWCQQRPLAKCDMSNPETVLGRTLDDPMTCFAVMFQSAKKDNIQKI